MARKTRGERGRKGILIGFDRACGQEKRVCKRAKEETRVSERSLKVKVWTSKRHCEEKKRSLGAYPHTYMYIRVSCINSDRLIDSQSATSQIVVVRAKTLGLDRNSFCFLSFSISLPLLSLFLFCVSNRSVGTFFGETRKDEAK